MLNKWKALALAIALVLTTAVVLSRSASSSAGKDDNDDQTRSNATVSFGEWMTTPPLDRYPDLSPISANHRAMIPREVKIKAGGSVNFIISGFHQVIVYDNGTQPGDINPTLLRVTTGNPAGLLILINDPNRRIYSGLDPSTRPEDRVEVVHFPNPGTFLVICGVRPHFVNDHMFGFVKVVPNNHEDDK